MAGRDEVFRGLDGVRLREYLEHQITALDCRLTQRLDLERRAAEQVRSALEARLEGMNDLRNAMRDQTTRYVTRDIYDTKHDLVLSEINAIKSRLSNLDGRTIVASAVLAVVVSAAVKWLVP